MKPSMKVSMIATGGTIASVNADGRWGNVSGHALLETAIDEFGVDARGIAVEDQATGSSSDLSTDDMVRIACRIRDVLHAGSDAVVVTHGTDTVELTAFVTQLLLGVGPDHPPVVFTGSMRIHSDPERDGLGNLADALAVARSASSVGRDVMVCMDGRVHAADRVRKVDARSLDAFSSAPFDPIGTVAHGQVVFAAGSTPRPASLTLAGHVPIVSCFPGMTADHIERIATGCDALVVEAFGDLNLPTSTLGPIHDLTRSGVPVVVSSACYTDRSESETLELLGAVGCGGLTTQRARLALMAALSTTADRDAIGQFIRRLAIAHEPGARRSRPRPETDGRHRGSGGGEGGEVGEGVGGGGGP